MIINVNGLHFQIKRYRLSERIKNKIQLNTVYKRLTLDFMTRVGWKWTGGERDAMQIITKRDQSQAKGTLGQELSQETAQLEDITTTHIYTPNIIAFQYTRQHGQLLREK